MSNSKILSLDQIAQRSNVLREQGKRVMLCHGTFDLIHIGHIRHLESAKKKGDVLLVTVTADQYVNKGPGRPVFNEHLRAESLAALECVDFVAINHAVTAVDALHKIKPSVYVKGNEYHSHGDDVTGNIIREQEAVEVHGGEVFFTDEIIFSSSSLLNEHFGIFTPDTKCYLKQFRKKWSEKEMHRMIGSLETINVLVLGDAIIDQYHYVSPLGKTAKDPVLAVQYETEEQFAGGSIAVANHIAAFTKSVTLVAGLGKTDSHEQFIRTKLKNHVTPVFSYFENAPTVTKRRFVNSDLAKLFEVYFFCDEPILEDAGQKTCQWLTENLPKYDVVVVADYGNGFVSKEMVQILCEKSTFLAVNTQVNSGNRGYHVINRYSRANFVSLNESELRLAIHNRHASLEEITEKVAARVDASFLAVTRGTQGAMMFDAKEKVFHKVPALSWRVIDRIGAGDAYLALSALCLGKGLPAEVAAFVGSVAGAMDVQIICNRESIDSVALKKYVSTLLK